jgi:hypothetical protein
MQHIGDPATNRLELSRMEHTLQNQRYQIEDPDQIKTKIA